MLTALSIVAPAGARIAAGLKTLEVRRWAPPNWRSQPLRDLVIVENTRFLSAALPCDEDGRAVALVDVVDVHDWRPDELPAACASAWEPGYLAWQLANVRPLPGTARVPALRKLYALPAQCLHLPPAQAASGGGKPSG